MSRFFDDGSSQYLEIDVAIAVTTPLTVTAWFYTDDDVNRQTMLFLGDKDASDQYFALRASGNRSGDPVSAMVNVGGTTSYADSTVGYSLNTWHHAGGVWYNDTDRAAYIDGRNKGTVASALTVVGPDRTSIGRSGDSTADYYMSGGLAEVVAWDVALTDIEMMIMALGYPSWRIRPNRRLGFWLPFGDRTDRDFSGKGYHMTAYNTPTWYADPPQVVSRYRRNRYHRTNDWGAPWWRSLAKSPALAPVEIAVTPTDFNYWKQGVKVVG